MNDFVAFAQSHGLIIDNLPREGSWVRTPTVEKPRKRNGAVKYLGSIGYVQNWETMSAPAIWQPEGADKTYGSNSGGYQSYAIYRNLRTARLTQIANQSQEAAQKAAKKACEILKTSEVMPHPYLASKGFPNAVINVWEGIHAFVPMRKDGVLVGGQIINPEGEKWFLYGQKSGAAEFVIGQKNKSSLHFFCEGYATGLSVSEALQSVRVKHVVHVCFSAGNMKKIAERHKCGFVIADNDTIGTGERAAREIGLPYWISDVAGEDFNDRHQRLGTFALAMELKERLNKTF